VGRLTGTIVVKMVVCVLHCKTNQIILGNGKAYWIADVGYQ